LPFAGTVITRDEPESLRELLKRIYASPLGGSARQNILALARAQSEMFTILKPVKLLYMTHKKG
jgi:hypothetical protein